MSNSYDEDAILGAKIERLVVSILQKYVDGGLVSAAAINDLKARLSALEEAFGNENIGERTADAFDSQSLKVGGVDVADATDHTVAFSQASSRGTAANDFSSGSKLSVLFGKVRKWFADLKSVAWSGSYADLSNKPTIPTVDQVYDSTSANAQSGVTVASALTTKQDTISDLSTIRSGASAGASALQPTGNGSDLSVTPDGTSTGYDLGSSTTLKAFAQKFKNLVGALKALAFKATVGTSDVDNDAITADKVKDNETLPVSVSGTAGGLANASYTSGGDGSQSNWSRCIKIDLNSARAAVSIRCLICREDSDNAVGFTDIIVKSQADNSWNGVSYVTRSELSNTILGKVGYYQTGSTIYLCISVGTWWTSVTPMLMGKVGDIDVTFGNYNSIVTTEPTSSNMLPSFINAHASVNTSVGSTSKPTWVDTDGSVKACSAELPSSYGTSGQYLKSNGADTAPSWDSTSNLSVGTTQNVATQGAASNSIARHVWFSDSSTETKRAHDDNLTYTPSTNTITANISGSAGKVGGKSIVVGSLGTDTNTIYFLTGA